jgi:thiosulfate/3-mercaptopyruvate sulfurtransferase
LTYTTLIDTGALAANLDRAAWAIVDCGFKLADTGWGEAAYLAGHIPGAVYAHLDRDLSGPKTGRNGRHPLPDMGALTARLSAWGIEPGTQVVAYDQDTGMAASRLWWLLRYLGHSAVAVLDGGLARWTAEGRPLRAGAEQRVPSRFVGEPQPAMLVAADEVEQLRQDPRARLIDVRAAERYRGDSEPLDPVAGHIPGAANYPYLSSLGPAGTFLAPAELRQQLRAVLDGVPPARAVFYCGSGVSAAHGVLALEHAGLPGARLYGGSWSEWCADPHRPVAQG